MWARRLLKLFAALLVLLAAFVYGYVLYPVWDWPLARHNAGPPPITPPWALECWLWEDDDCDAAAVRELIDGYRQHDFPVRTILIDSPWSTRYNDFIVDEERYPEPEKFFRGLQDEGYRVVLWMTCFANRKSDDTRIEESSDWFEAAKAKGYLASEGYEIPWWKGRGALVDYTNPEAMRWWRGMQQQVFDWGIDGWKLDGTATYFHAFWGPIPAPYGRTHAGAMRMRKYMNHYYGDEYRHGLTQNPEFVTLARAVDNGELPNAHPWGFAPLDAAPVTWVGDNKHTWDDEGLLEALADIFQSARLGYSVIGSDVAGYHGPKIIPERLYIRWAQFSAFCGLFLNGGHGERRMWKRTREELEIIREFSWLHTELVPYMYSHVVAAHGGGEPLMRPLDIGTWQYLFGGDFLVAPIYEDSLTRTVVFPEGTWRYYFDDGETVEGPATTTRDYPLGEFPVYVRDGAIVPMHVERAYTGIGDANTRGMLTLDCYPAGESRFDVRPAPGIGPFGTLSHDTPIAVTMTGGSAVAIALEGPNTPLHLRVRMPAKPAEVARDGVPIAEGAGWRYDAAAKRVHIRDEIRRADHYTIR